jgi:site-specific recombinase XerD
MQKLLDIHFNYLCRSSHLNKEGQNPITLRIVYRRERKDIFTGLYCFKSNWNGEEQRISKREDNYATLNQNLSLILRKAANAFDELKFSGSDFTLTDLSDKIRGREDKPLLLIDFLEQGNQKMKSRVGTEILAVTYKKYERSLRFMKNFLESQYRVKNFNIQKVNTDFLASYFHFLLNNRKIAHNTACKYLICVKTVFLMAIRSGLLRENPFIGLRINPKPVAKQFLSSDEIDKLGKLVLKNPDLDRKKDIFLFACYTGLAYIDLQQLNSTHLIKDRDSSWYILKPRQKTGQESIIPLLPAAMRILSKYSANGDIADFKWQISTNQKMNLGLKYIGKKAGICKPLHMHLARHTFATTITLSNGVPIETVSKMLGHASIKQTQHYAKVIPLKIKIDMQKIHDLYL